MLKREKFDNNTWKEIKNPKIIQKLSKDQEIIKIAIKYAKWHKIKQNLRNYIKVN